MATKTGSLSSDYSLEIEFFKAKTSHKQKG